MRELHHAQSCIYPEADCDCGLAERLAEELEADQERVLPADEQVISWAIHDDHAQGNDEYEEPF
jgi:hypothetical protein